LSAAGLSAEQRHERGDYEDVLLLHLLYSSSMLRFLVCGTGSANAPEHERASAVALFREAQAAEIVAWVVGEGW
jgi:hypothetical protein